MAWSMAKIYPRRKHNESFGVKLPLNSKFSNIYNCSGVEFSPGTFWKIYLVKVLFASVVLVYSPTNKHILFKKPLNPSLSPWTTRWIHLFFKYFPKVLLIYFLFYTIQFTMCLPPSTSCPFTLIHFGGERYTFAYVTVFIFPTIHSESDKVLYVYPRT